MHAGDCICFSGGLSTVATELSGSEQRFVRS